MVVADYFEEGVEEDFGKAADGEKPEGVLDHLLGRDMHRVVILFGADWPDAMLYRLGVRQLRVTHTAVGGDDLDDLGMVGCGNRDVHESLLTLSTPCRAGINPLPKNP